MSSILASIAVLVPPWKRKKSVPRFSCSLNDDSVPVPKKSQPKVSFDPFEEFNGLEVKLLQPSASKPRSWVGPNGQYIRELPCPSCRGRGYTLCTECGIEKPRLDCSQCNGKGLKTCPQCMGDCVIWEESIDERPWEKARSISRFKVKEDDEVDDLDIKLDARKKSKRLYRSPPPEVGLKISRSLRSLNAKTGLFTKRMKIIHQDPMLHAQRVAAIKKTKQTAAARKQASEAMKAFFREPANRHRRSIAMKGVKFYCQNCGREGHRRHYCPELKLLERRFRCGLCGEVGHNRRSCQKSSSGKSAVPRADRLRHRNHGNNNANYGRTSQETDIESGEIDGTSTSFLAGRRKYRCRLCQEKGHNWRTCPNKMSNEISKNES